MRKKTKKEQEKLTKILKTPKVAKKQERKLKRKMQGLRRVMRKQQADFRSHNDMWFDEQAERARIIREVEQEEQEETNATEGARGEV